MATLLWNHPAFLSIGDEELSFEWMRRIKAIRSWHGIVHTIHIHVRKPVSNADLRELIAFFWKYNIEMTQLTQFQTARNAKWFCSPKSYWFKRVFGLPPAKSLAVRRIPRKSASSTRPRPHNR